MQDNNRLRRFANSKSFSSITAALLAIVLGLIIGFIIMLIASPENAGGGFSKVLTGGLSRMGDVFYFATPILMTGLAVGFAFKMGMFNIGASDAVLFAKACDEMTERAKKLGPNPLKKTAEVRTT